MTDRQDRGPVQLFVTCIVDVFYPSVGRAVVRVLEEQGFTVEFPKDQTCCGQPAFNTGHLSEAMAMAEHTVRVLDATEGRIVVPSGSCAAMIIDHYEDLFSGDGDLLDAGRRVASRAHEFTQFLVDEIGLEGVASEMTGTATFHPSCHGLRHLGLGGYGEAVLDQAGVERCDLKGADECCGFGGLFAVEMPELSASIMDVKLDNATATGADTLVGYDMSCLMHLSGGLRRRGSPITVRHIAEVIAGADDE
jgi:L-lactate dehydrogenase complex protein LldE